MNTIPSHNRRKLIQLGALGGLSLLPAGSLFAADKEESKSTETEKDQKPEKMLRVIAIGAGGRAVGNIKPLEKHKAVEFVGFCDVDTRMMNRWKKSYPDALYLQDYRVFFRDHLDKFDAVVMSTPDHSHAPIILTAMAADKHIYAEKPLVHQLDELRMVRNAVAAKPKLVTQMGNQRSCMKGKMEIVEMLRNGELGKIKEAWVWVGRMKASGYFVDPWLDQYPEAKPAPEELDWELWKSCSKAKVGYHPDMARAKWRAFWEYGSGPIGDWGCHILDTLFYGLNLESGPLAVKTEAPRGPSKVSVGTYLQSTMTFKGNAQTSGDFLEIHFNDGPISPPNLSYGLPRKLKPQSNMTLIVTEAGTLLTTAVGGWKLYKDGKDISASVTIPKVKPRHHWHDWVDNCLGAKKPLWSPLDVGSLITEAALLPVKASVFQGRELGWDSKACRFDLEEANAKVVSREYADGFGIPKEFV